MSDVLYRATKALRYDGDASLTFHQGDIVRHAAGEATYPDGKPKPDTDGEVWVECPDTDRRGFLAFAYLEEIKPDAPATDIVNHPPHYNFGTIEVIDAIEDWGLPYFLGNVVKYVARCDYKGHAIEDLRKAQFYLQREIEKREKADQAAA